MKEKMKLKVKIGPMNSKVLATLGLVLMCIVAVHYYLAWDQLNILIFIFLGIGLTSVILSRRERTKGNKICLIGMGIYTVLTAGVATAGGLLLTPLGLSVFYILYFVIGLGLLIEAVRIKGRMEEKLSKGV